MVANLNNKTIFPYTCKKKNHGDKIFSSTVILCELLVNVSDIGLLQSEH